MTLKCFADAREKIAGFRDHQVKWFIESCLHGIEDEYERKYRTARRLYDIDQISNFEFTELVTDAEWTAKRRCENLMNKINELKDCKYNG